MLPSIALAATDAPDSDDDFFNQLYMGVAALVALCAIVYVVLNKKGKNGKGEVEQLMMDHFVPKDKDGKVRSEFLSPEDRLLQKLDENLAEFDINNGNISLEGTIKLKAFVLKHCSEEHKPEKLK